MQNNAELGSAEMIGVVEVAEKQLSEVQLYTTKAFEGGNAARSLLDTSMQDLDVYKRQANLYDYQVFAEKKTQGMEFKILAKEKER